MWERRRFPQTLEAFVLNAHELACFQAAVSRAFTSVVVPHCGDWGAWYQAAEASVGNATGATRGASGRGSP